MGFICGLVDKPFHTVSNGSGRVGTQVLGTLAVDVVGKIRSSTLG